MSALREAAQQALEALEALDAPPSGVVDHYELDRRKQALRAALAQEEPIRPTVQEMQNAAANLKLMEEIFGGSTARAQEDVAQNLQSRLDAALLLEERRQEIAQPRRETEQEPVAWQWLNSAYFRKKPPANAESGAWNPLYAHPPRREWQGLTEEEIEDMSVTGTDSELRRQQFARAVEQALKEKNQ
jgi:hypothetical protein